MPSIRSLLDAGKDESVALIAEAGTLSWKELRYHVDRLAAQLRAAGLGPQDRIALVLPNGPAMALAFLAVTSVGCAAPLNPKYREDEFRFYLEDLAADALLAPIDEMTQARSARSAGTLMIDVSGEFPDIAFSCPAGSAGSSTSVVSVSPDNIALVLHTSGTTARPKIVPLSQRNLCDSAASISQWRELTATDRSLNVMPLFHIHGLVAGMLAPLAAGGAVIATEGFDAFKFQGWLDRFEPTFYTAVPTMHKMILARAGDPAQTSLRFIRSSSASLPPPVLSELESHFGVPVIEAYGMTEASHQMTSNPLPPGRPKPGSVGLATGIEMVTLDSEGNVLPHGERGEVAIRGKSVMDGYEANPSANGSAFANGWFRTGDEGAIDDDGYLTLTGRLKEQINRGGEKISPLEIDEVLLAHPEVAQAVVFGVQHPKLGEDVAAAVVLTDNSELTPAQVREHAKESLAGFKVPREVLVVDEIPKGPTGKVQRVGLAEVFGLNR
ncbi:MAG: acyl--CoA ligase [Acidimicrobiales bacterium]